MGTRFEAPLFHADRGGIPLRGGLLYTYTVGTTTAKATYSEYTLTTENANPVVLNARGEATVYCDGAYKFILKSSAGDTIWTFDNWSGQASEEVGTHFYYVDASEADQGAATTGGASTVKDFIDTIGATNKGTIVLPRGSTGATTDFTFTNSETATSNIYFQFEAGSRFSIASGKTVTLGTPENVIAQPGQEISTGDGTLAYTTSIPTLDNNATPTILRGSHFLTGGTTTITDFDDGVAGQVITIISEHAVTITEGTNIFLRDSISWTMAATDTLTLKCKADGLWYELGRSPNVTSDSVRLLSRTASCNLNATAGTEKSLFTVPTSRTLIVDHVVMHTFSADTGNAVVTFGKTGGTCEEYLGDQTLSGITASYATQSLHIQVVPNATTVVQSMFTAAQVFAMEITTAAGSACTCTVDLFGYLI